MDTHFPYYFEADAQSFFRSEEYESDRFKHSGEAIGPELREGKDREYMDATYDGDLLFADRQLGRVFDALNSRGWLDLLVPAIAERESLFARQASRSRDSR